MLHVVLVGSRLRRAPSGFARCRWSLLLAFSFYNYTCLQRQPGLADRCYPFLYLSKEAPQIGKGCQAGYFTRVWGRMQIAAPPGQSRWYGSCPGWTTSLGGTWQEPAARLRMCMWQSRTCVIFTFLPSAPFFIKRFQNLHCISLMSWELLLINVLL